MDAVPSSHTQKDSGKQPGGVNEGGVGVGGMNSDSWFNTQ